MRALSAKIKMLTARPAPGGRGPGFPDQAHMFRGPYAGGGIRGIAFGRSMPYDHRRKSALAAEKNGKTAKRQKRREGNEIHTGLA